MKPHKHKDLIIAWANGAEIQERVYFQWWDRTNPDWDNESVFRIKPEPKPDVVYYFEIDRYKNFHQIDTVAGKPNIKLTFDGETGELKSAEVLK